MSSSAVHQCPNVSVLAKLLADEKEVTRVWLRAEMDRLVDPMLDSIFSRLETKLTNGLERTQSTGAGDCAQVNSSFSEKSENVPQSAKFICPPSTIFVPSFKPTSSRREHQHVTSNCPKPSPFTLTSANLTHQLVLTNDQSPPPPTEPIPLDLRSIRQSSRTCPVAPPPVSSTNPQINFPNQLTNVQSRPMSIKHDIEAAATEPKRVDRFPQSLSAPTFNEQSNNDNLANWDEEDEEECDCEECVDGIVIKEKGDHSDCVRRIEHGQELCPPAKKPKIYLIRPNSAQPEVIGESCAQATVEPQLEPQPNKVDKRYTTVHLQCPQANCLETYPEDQLNRHMLDKHGIGPHQCLVKDCAQSFANHFAVGQHIKSVHSAMTEWHCGKCAKCFASYHSLSSHHFALHQLGHFECTFPSCTFTGEYRKRLYNHHARQHKQSQTLNCEHCAYRTSDSTDMKIHQRVHSGNKPYRCKWQLCYYAATRRDLLIKHIRRHLALNPQLNGAPLDPKDYVELVHDLL